MSPPDNTPNTPRWLRELREAFPQADVQAEGEDGARLRFEPGVQIVCQRYDDAWYRSCMPDDQPGLPADLPPVCAVSSANPLVAVRAQLAEVARLWRAQQAARQTALNAYLYGTGLAATEGFSDTLLAAAPAIRAALEQWHEREWGKK